MIMEFAYSTNKVTEMQRFDYWQDVVCKHCIPAASDSTFRENFEADIVGRSIGSLAVSRMSGPEHSWTRDIHSIRTGPEDNLWLSYMERGVGVLQQNNRTVVQGDGDMVLYDAARPFTYSIAPESLYIVRIPRELLRHRTARAENLVATSLGIGTGFRAVLGSMVREVNSPEALGHPPLSQARIAGSILEMVSALIELHHGQQEAISVQVDLYHRVLGYIQDNIESDDLNVDQIAAAMRVSSRTLSRALAVHGTTPMKCVWQKRLEASYCALREGNVRNVTEAAMTYGFCDLSHFSKAFKKTYAVTPQSLLAKR
jgi:AraC-like DNA-binding protein